MSACARTCRYAASVFRVRAACLAACVHEEYRGRGTRKRERDGKIEMRETARGKKRVTELERKEDEEQIERAR